MLRCLLLPLTLGVFSAGLISCNSENKTAAEPIIAEDPWNPRPFFLHQDKSKHDYKGTFSGALDSQIQFQNLDIQQIESANLSIECIDFKSLYPVSIENLENGIHFLDIFPAKIINWTHEPFDCQLDIQLVNTIGSLRKYSTKIKIEKPKQTGLFQPLLNHKINAQTQYTLDDIESQWSLNPNSKAGLIHLQCDSYSRSVPTGPNRVAKNLSQLLDPKLLFKDKGHHCRFLWQALQFPLNTQISPTFIIINEDSWPVSLSIAHANGMNSPFEEPTTAMPFDSRFILNGIMENNFTKLIVSGECGNATTSIPFDFEYSAGSFPPKIDPSHLVHHSLIPLGLADISCQVQFKSTFENQVIRIIEKEIMIQQPLGKNEFQPFADFELQNDQQFSLQEIKNKKFSNQPVDGILVSICEKTRTIAATNINVNLLFENFYNEDNFTSDEGQRCRLAWQNLEPPFHTKISSSFYIKNENNWPIELEIVSEDNKKHRWHSQDSNYNFSMNSQINFSETEVQILAANYTINCLSVNDESFTQEGRDFDFSIPSVNFLDFIPDDFLLKIQKFKSCTLSLNLESASGSRRNFTGTFNGDIKENSFKQGFLENIGINYDNPNFIEDFLTKEFANTQETGRIKILCDEYSNSLQLTSLNQTITMRNLLPSSVMKDRFNLNCKIVFQKSIAPYKTLMTPTFGLFNDALKVEIISPNKPTELWKFQAEGLQYPIHSQIHFSGNFLAQTKAEFELACTTQTNKILKHQAIPFILSSDHLKIIDFIPSHYIGPSHPLKNCQLTLILESPRGESRKFTALFEGDISQTTTPFQPLLNLNIDYNQPYFLHDLQKFKLQIPKKRGQLTVNCEHFNRSINVEENFNEILVSHLLPYSASKNYFSMFCQFIFQNSEAPYDTAVSPPLEVNTELKPLEVSIVNLFEPTQVKMSGENIDVAKYNLSNPNPVDIFIKLIQPTSSTYRVRPTMLQVDNGLFNNLREYSFPIQWTLLGGSSLEKNNKSMEVKIPKNSSVQMVGRSPIQFDCSRYNQAFIHTHNPRYVLHGMAHGLDGFPNLEYNRRGDHPKGRQWYPQNYQKYPKEIRQGQYQGYSFWTPYPMPPNHPYGKHSNFVSEAYTAGDHAACQ